MTRNTSSRSRSSALASFVPFALSSVGFTMTRSFYNQNSDLTMEQCAAIGSVASRWSLLEYALERVLTRLAMAPDFVGMALTNDLGINNRIVALKNLTEIHRHRYHPPIVATEILDQLDSMRSSITRLKDRRNRIVHYVWFRRDDTKMFGIRFRGKLPPRDPKSDSNEVIRVSEVLATSREIEALANQMLDISRSLPERPETSHDRSASRIDRNPHQKKRPR